MLKISRNVVIILTDIQKKCEVLNRITKKVLRILRQSAKLKSQMVSGPPCMLQNDWNSFELSIYQGVQPVGIPTFWPNSYFCPTFYFYSYFLTKFLLLQRFGTKTKILLNKDLNSVQIIRIYLHICLLLFELNSYFLLYLSYLLDTLEYWLVQQHKGKNHKSLPKILSEMNI